jgi:hypothetical protein
MEDRFGNFWTKLVLLSLSASPLLGQTPSVTIDGPVQGASVSGVITVSGWAIDNMQTFGTAISLVTVQVDGKAVGIANQGISRPDVCSQYPARPGCPNVGYAYSLDTSSLTPGIHSITVVATDADLVPDTGSATVQVTVGTSQNLPSSPLVAIDSPTSGAAVSGMITVTGWALDNASGVGTPINSVQVMVDGVAAGTATYGLPRPDACGQYPGRPGCPNVGFSFSLNTGTYSQGTHVISVVATDSDASPDTGVASTSVTVVPAPSVMIDNITPGAVVSNVISISGWAIDNTTTAGTAISSVQILVDGKLVGTANYGASRPDVCGLYPGRPGCPNVGFTYTLDTRVFAPGLHTLTAQATDSDPVAETGSWTANITVTAPPPTVTIENPMAMATVFGMFPVSGWALNTNSGGPAISSVQVTLDGTVLGPANYGFSRPDVCVPYGAGCPNVGFAYYGLSSNQLAPGAHTVTVTATDSGSPPQSTSSSVTFYVAQPM